MGGDCRVALKRSSQRQAWGGSMSGNPRTEDEARAFVAHVESLFMPWNIEALLAGFTEDCVIRFGDLPELRGKPALEDLFQSRMGRQKGYRLKKEFRALSGDKIANYWEGWWEDRPTGKKMQGRGVEVWTMRDGQIAVWEAAFNAKEEGGTSAMGLL
jgi:nuclear transport factor 2 (NTF2) superfamily protein